MSEWTDYMRANRRARDAYRELTACSSCGATPNDPRVGSRPARCLMCRHKKGAR